VRCLFTALISLATLFELAAFASESHRLNASLETLCRESTECLARNAPELARLGMDIERILQFHLKEVRELRAPSASDDLLLRRAILNLRKLHKYCENGIFEKLGERPITAGQYDERDPLLGSAAGELDLLRTSATPAIRNFIHSLYQGGAVCSFDLPRGDEAQPAHLFMIEGEHADRAEALARLRLGALLAEKNPGRPTEMAYQPSAFRPGVTWTYDIDNDWNDWRVAVDVDPRGISLREGHWKVPASIVTLHELGHVARIRPGDPDSDPSNEAEAAILAELGPVIEQIVLQDEVAKAIHGSPLDSKRTYPCHPPAPPGKPPLDLGEAANVFRGLIREHGSPERAVLSPEGQRFIESRF